MIFLISYDRSTQQLTQEVEEFDDDDSAQARRRRLELQLSHRDADGRYEIVLIEAVSLETVKVSHARYFSSERDLIAAAKRELNATAERVHRKGSAT